MAAQINQVSKCMVVNKCLCGRFISKNKEPKRSKFRQIVTGGESPKAFGSLKKSNNVEGKTDDNEQKPSNEQVIAEDPVNLTNA